MSLADRLDLMNREDLETTSRFGAPSDAETPQATNRKAHAHYLQAPQVLTAGYS